MVAKLNNNLDIRGPIAPNPSIMLPKLKHTNGKKVNQVPSYIQATLFSGPSSCQK